MDYSAGLHNGAGQYVAALVLFALGVGALWRVYKLARPGSAILSAALVLSGLLALGMILWSRADGPCDTVRGVPLIVERVQSACTDVIVSTGVSLPMAVLNALVAVGLAHVILLGVLTLRRARAHE
jgi:hypothetical protein